MQRPRDPREGAALIVGLALVAAGVYWLARNTGLVPAWIFDLAGRAVFPLAVIGAGALVIYVAIKGDLRGPGPGARLYRSRTDRWLGGVVAGLASYLGLDAVVLRLAVLLLAFAGFGGILVPAYIIMWIVVPEEPVGYAPYVPPGPTAPPTQGA
jgi:phage shock protein PspC (stress-responsive transcriptional regulator)